MTRKQPLRGTGAKRCFGLVAALAAVALPGAAFAGTEGLVFGLSLLSDRIDADVGATDSPLLVERIGAGLNIHAGWSFGPSFPVRLSATLAGHETNDPEFDLSYGSVAIEGMVLFRNPEPMRPYLYGGVGGFGLRSRDAGRFLETTGPGVLFGGGVLYFLGDSFALDFSARGEFVDWKKTRATRVTPTGTETVDTPIREEGRAAKVLIGVSWWP